ncbi:TonB-dependent receptor [Geothrix oryzisoli]|uniref:TonB-dependent receptor n=1 Tax=Geothrix oryzisoli TaxID=2922721 RepID=UPI001FACEB41|nr:TonB-dependent receptor [Geothrix oryzisoli]
MFQTPPPVPPAAVVEVTATRFPEDPAKVPASITVLTARDLAERGATDLGSALALLAGVSIAPGGDGGPAGSVPEFWGLKEFDAFLLVVDGVPWGGAFNPALSTLSLEGVERIEIQRGSAPVLYGATSFVGVIHVIRGLPPEGRGTARLSAGSHGTFGGAVSLRLPARAGTEAMLTVDHDSQGFEDARTGFKRTHLLWRNRIQALDGVVRFDLEGTAADQQPASPFPRVGRTLTDQVPLNANHNPAGAYLNDRRATFTTGYERTLASATLWSTTLSVSRARQDAFRGFLTDVGTTAPNAHGFRERIDLTDVYLDSHLTWLRGDGLKLVAGLDHLHGQGRGRGGDFDYLVNLDGSGAPGAADLPSQADIRIDDRRDFSGFYALAQWQVAPRLIVEAGLRLTRAEETRRTATLDFASGTEEGGSDARTTTRLGGSAGATWTAWRRGEDRVNLFAGVRSTFKPAAMDFGLDSGSLILKPETATSYDLGLKADLVDRKLALEVSTFLMDFEDLVVPQSAAGAPVLVNAGTERFQGVEASAIWRLTHDLAARLAYSYHDARFRDYAKDFGDGTLTQLAGKRLEMSPYHLGGLGLTYAPAQGFTASAEMAYVGAVFLNQRNTAPAGGYATFATSLGWRERTWELRLEGRNLTDCRKPVAESELGDAQYYLLPGRQVSVTARYRF